MLERQVAGNPESRAAGMVINTMGWIDGVGYEVRVSSFKSTFSFFLSLFKLLAKEWYLLSFLLQLLLHAIDTFKASVVLVLGQEKLFSMLKDVLRSKSNVDVVKLHKSGGVVARSSPVRKVSRAFRIQVNIYFHSF